jgi:hypothetical protein
MKRIAIAAASLALLAATGTAFAEDYYNGGVFGMRQVYGNQYGYGRYGYTYSRPSYDSYRPSYDSYRRPSYNSYNTYRRYGGYSSYRRGYQD